MPRKRKDAPVETTDYSLVAAQTISKPAIVRTVSDGRERNLAAREPLFECNEKIYSSVNY